MKIIISGASGFLGRNLVDKILKETNFCVVALTSNPKAFVDSAYLYNKRLKIIYKDDYENINWAELDVFINCAFPRDNDGSQLAEGLLYLSKIFESAKEGGVKSVINISSQSVYSQFRTFPAKEDTTINLESKYAVAKYATEIMFNQVFKDVPHTNLRLASLIGPSFDQRVTNKLIYQVMQGKDLEIEGGNQTFGFFDIRDAVDGILCLIKSNSENWRTIYNFGTNNSCTLEQISKCICIHYNMIFDSDITYKLKITEDMPTNSSLDCSLFFRDFNWKPKLTMKDSLEYIFNEVIDNKQ